MTVDDLIKRFGSTAAICKELKVTRAAISQWRSGGIPEMRQWQIEAITRGQLKRTRQPHKASVA